MARARELRSNGAKGLGMKTYGSLLAHLLLRTWSRAERVHLAMLARGFTGEFHTRGEFRFGMGETLFLLGWSAAFIFFRFNNCSQLCGALFARILP
jgi:cobalt/nickel transport system permease protein